MSPAPFSHSRKPAKSFAGTAGPIVSAAVELERRWSALGLADDPERDAYEKALAIEDTVDMRLALGQLLFDEKRFDQAKTHLKAATDKNDDPAVLATVARMMGFMKSFDDLLEVLAEKANDLSAA